MRTTLNALYRIISDGLNTNSYKFALARALVHLSQKTDANHPAITKADLAPLFVQYYWPLEVTYYVRQGIDPKKDPVVMRMIRELVQSKCVTQGQKLANFQRQSPEKYQKLVANVTRYAFNDVIARFHTVHAHSITPAIYTFDGKPGKVSETIVLTEDGRAVLNEYGSLVDYLAVSGWVRFTEAFTTAPKLHDKIAGTKMSRRSLVEWCKVLSYQQGGGCFYGSGHDMSAPEVDHFLPWSFVLEDKTWNLVLSCRECNNAKRDRMPGTSALDRLIQRNERIQSGKEPRGSAADADKFTRDFKEWRSRSLSSHIRALYDQAVADGFPEWDVPK